MLTLDDWITSSGSHPERASDSELTDEVMANAQRLLDAVNPFLDELGITPPPVSSGFRPSTVNAALPNSAKRSLHMTGLAIDLRDKNNELDRIVVANSALLTKYGLWLESPASTPGWTHLDLGTRSDRPVRIFQP
jgi:hypothetical protein